MCRVRTCQANLVASDTSIWAVRGVTFETRRQRDIKLTDSNGTDESDEGSFGEHFDGFVVELPRVNDGLSGRYRPRRGGRTVDVELRLTFQSEFNEGKGGL